MAASALVMFPAVPPDYTYHRIVSPTLSIPTDTSVPVGLLACQRDPLLKELETYVILCEASVGLEVSKDTKKKIQPAQQGEPMFQVLLQDTILFPEGGGQPSDIGFIQSGDGSRWDVLEVKRRGGHAIHYIKGGQTTLHTLSSGTRVKVALGAEGFKRRYDHMCMHTSQHLISALLETRLKLPTPSWYLTQSPNPAYIEVPRAPTAEELQAIEDAANEYCTQGTRLHVEVEELDVVTKSRDNEDRNAFKGLPADYTGGVNRTVVIENVDRNPCCGTHLPTLQGLSVFILPQTEALSRGRARIFFCAGPRVRAYLSQTHNLLTTAATTYGCAASQVPERLAFETDGRRKAHKRAEELENEVARFVIKDLQDEQQQIHGDDGHRFSAFRHRYDSSSNPLTLLATIHSTWSTSSASSFPFLIVLVSSGLQSSSNNAVVLVFGSDEKEVRDLGDRLKANGIKGGGKAGKWSGKTDNWMAAGGDEWVKGLLKV